VIGDAHERNIAGESGEKEDPGSRAAGNDDPRVDTRADARGEDPDEPEEERHGDRRPEERDLQS